MLWPHYRLNALLDRASDQGVLCHLAVAEQLGSGESSFLLLGANLKQRSTHLGEVDLLGFQSSFLMSGEMKMSAGGFTDDEIRRAVQLAKLIRADVLVFGCTEALDATLQESMLAAGGSEALKVWIVDPTGKSTDVAPPRAPSGPMT